MLKTAFKKFVAMACVLFLMVSLLGVSAFAADMHPRTLTYMGNGGVDAGGGTEFVYNYEEEDGKGTIIMPNGGDGFPNFAREGFKFIGWNTTADGSGTKYRGVLDDDTYSVVVDIPYSAFTNGALTLYAQWLPASDSGYMVRYEVNGGVTPSNKTFCDCPSDGPDKLFIVVPNEGFSDFSRKGYTFIGWNTKADGSGTKYNGLLEFSSYSSTIEIFPVDYVNNVFTLYAQWKANSTGTTTEKGPTVVSERKVSDSSYGVIAPKVVATPSYEEPEIAPDTGLGSTYAGVLLLAAVLAAAVYGSKK